MMEPEMRLIYTQMASTNNQVRQTRGGYVIGTGDDAVYIFFLDLKTYGALIVFRDRMTI